MKTPGAGTRVETMSDVPTQGSAHREWGRALKAATTVSLAVATALAVLCGEASATPLNYSQIRYNQVRMKQIHNAMQTEEPIPDMLLYHAVRSFEFDIHNRKGCGDHGELKGDWWLYHSGDCASEGSSHTAETLSDALKEVQTFHLQNPLHEVLTIYIDQHDDFEPDRTPGDLDKAIDRFFPFDPLSAKSHTFTPYHLYWSGRSDVFPTGSPTCPCATLQACVDGTYTVAKHGSCQWPLLSQLRGKVIFVLTGGNDHAHEYTDSGRSWKHRRAFATYDHTSVTSRSAWDPTGHLVNDLGYDRFSWELFFNQDRGDTSQKADCQSFPEDCGQTMPQILNGKHMISRSFGSGANHGETNAWAKEDWHKQVDNGVQIIGTDDVNQVAYPWASTNTPHGFPFDCSYTPKADCRTKRENLGAGMFFHLEVGSGDIDTGSDTDSFAFAEGYDPKDHFYSVEVLVPSSWTNDWAKGCVMARRNRYPHSPYFAVCRTANSESIQIQYRLAQGTDSDGGDADNLDAVVKTVSLGGYHDNGIPIEGIAFIRIRSRSGSRVFSADASRDGVDWHQVAGPIQFSAPLKHKGIAVTSHGQPHQLWRFDQYNRGTCTGGPASCSSGVQIDPGPDFWLIHGDARPTHHTGCHVGCTFKSPGHSAWFLHYGRGWGP